VERIAPASETTWSGGGVRNRINTIGKAKTLSVFTLNIIRMNPATNRDRENMWYSNGVNV